MYSTLLCRTLVQALEVCFGLRQRVSSTEKAKIQIRAALSSVTDALVAKEK